MTSPDHGHFSVHRGQFLSDSDVRGLVFRLRRCIRAFTRVFGVIGCHKTVSAKCVVTKDRARTLTSELSQGVSRDVNNSKKGPRGRNIA